MAPEICVAVSQPLGRPILNDGSRTLETGCGIDVHFVHDATAEIGLNDYVYTLKKRECAVANFRSRRKHSETQVQLTAIGAVW